MAAVDKVMSHVKRKAHTLHNTSHTAHNAQHTSNNTQSTAHNTERRTHATSDVTDRAIHLVIPHNTKQSKNICPIRAIAAVFEVFQLHSHAPSLHIVSFKVLVITPM
jgi:hypothetical protein